jgi:hypothetical protein
MITNDPFINVAAYIEALRPEMRHLRIQLRWMACVNGYCEDERTLDSEKPTMHVIVVSLARPTSANISEYEHQIARQQLTHIKLCESKSS